MILPRGPKFIVTPLDNGLMGHAKQMRWAMGARSQNCSGCSLAVEAVAAAADQ